MGHVHELIHFEGGDATLTGTLQIPDGAVRGGVLLAHCFTCSRSLKVTRHLATQIEDAGFAVLRFDFTGLGESEGDFVDTNVTTNIADLHAAAAYLEKRNLGPDVLVGHSLGGAATLLAAEGIERARAVVAVAAPFGPEHVRHLFSETDVDRVFAEGRAEVRIAGRPFHISKQFFEDIEEHCTADRVAAIGRPVLVVHGTDDTVVGISEGERIFDAASHPKWFAAIPGADHLFVKPGAIDHAGNAIRTFLDTVI